MKFRILLISFLILLSLPGYGQPVEVIYPGNVIKSGYADDASYGPFNIGFSFTYFGNVYTQFYVNSNGQILFGSGSTVRNNVTIPTAGLPENFISAFWDDLVIDGTGSILYATIGASPSRRLIVQFRNMGFYGIPPFLGSFSVILYEGSNKIQIQYRLIVDNTSAKAHGESATIGIENSTGSDGVLYAYNNPTAVNTGKAISFTPSGVSYTMNSDAYFEWIYLTTNITLPEPSIPLLLSPAQDAVIGSDYSFEWSEAGNSASYTLLISKFSDLGGGTTYNAGTNLSYTVTGLDLNSTYYWGVFATNATGTTWCEIKRFTTSSAPPLAAVPQTVWVEQNQEKTIKLNYTGGDASTKTAKITSLPAQGQLYQYNAGIKGALISSFPADVTDPGRNVIYVANGTYGNSAGNFNFNIHDDTSDSPTALVTVNVSPPGMPNLLYTGKATTYIEMQFDRIMADPSGKQSQFTVTVNGTPVSLSSLALKSGDPYTITATLPAPILLTDAVTVAYSAGTVASLQGGLLASFDAQTITLRAQTITFTTNLTKKYGDAPFALSATVSSGLSMTYSSSNLTVATISGTTLTIRTVGSSEITARQAGNATFAPAKYVRTLTVAKGDQTIAFGVIPGKIFGDPDFSVSATASSGLSVSFASGNSAVATLSGNSVHITGAGFTTITASQAGNSLWNPATDVPQSLTVSKADQTITFGPILDKTFGDPDFQLFATTSSGLVISYLSSNTSIATLSGDMVHITGVGSTTITASQAGNANYNPATDVSQPFSVFTGNATVTLGSLSAVYDGLPHAASAVTVPAGLSVLFTYDGSASPPVNAGSYTVEASVDNPGYHGTATGTLVISKAGQTITFSPLPGKTYGDADFTLSAVAGSALQVTYISSNTAVAAVTGNTVTIAGAGTTTITASQPGDANWNPAPDVQQLFTVSKASQTITFTPPDVKTFGDADFTLSAVAGSGLQVTYISSNTAVATVTGNTVTIAGAGTTTITASQAGDANYNAAPDVPQILTVNRALQTITFTDFPTSLLATESYTLAATSSGGVTVLFESLDDNLATVSGDQLTGVAKGNVQIRAYNDGGQNYLPAEAIITVEIVSTHKDVMNLFTPNGDGFNDLWELPELQSWGRCEVRVFSRSGKQVFADDNYNNTWDGSSNGKPVPEGAYYFVIKTENAGVVKGTVNIVR